MSVMDWASMTPMASTCDPGSGTARTLNRIPVTFEPMVWQWERLVLDSCCQVMRVTCDQTGASAGPARVVEAVAGDGPGLAVGLVIRSLCSE